MRAGCLPLQAMIPELHKILYGEVDHTPVARGRLHSTARDTDIKLVTGTMSERIAYFLRKGDSCTASEIAVGTLCTVSQVSRQLKKMVESGAVEIVAVEGCATEYMLAKKD